MNTPGRPRPMKQSEFQKAVIDKYRPQFDLHWRVREMLESAFAKDRYLDQLVTRAIDMLFLQCFKAHVSTFELAALAQVEDAATIVRRLLELAAQAHYIGLHADAEERQRRAGAFLAFMWMKWPEEAHGAIAVDERQAWEKVLDVHGGHFKPDPRQWGPHFGEIFSELESRDQLPAGAWRNDYRYLSNVAHGCPPSLVHSYGQPIIPVHDDRQVPAILVAGSSYALLCAMVWNEVTRLIPDAQLSALAQEITEMSRRPAGRREDR
jgi:hypothetical protein